MILLIKKYIFYLSDKSYCILISEDQILLTIVKINKFNHKYCQENHIL